MKKNILLKIVCMIFIIISICVFVITNFILSDTYELFNETYYIPLIIIQLTNKLFTILFFKSNKTNNKYIITYLVFLLLILCIPIYHNGITYAPTGPNSHLMGLAFEERYFDIYGINISKIVRVFK